MKKIYLDTGTIDTKEHKGAKDEQHKRLPELWQAPKLDKFC